jgi:transcriptional regulator with GAF, ATPase, and Fis domain
MQNHSATPIPSSVIWSSGVSRTFALRADFLAHGAMNAVSCFFTHVDGYRGVATRETTLRHLDKGDVRKLERSQPPFLETIVGRRGGLRTVLFEVQAVAPTNATVLISGETGTARKLSRERFMS